MEHPDFSSVLSDYFQPLSDTYTVNIMRAEASPSSIASSGLDGASQAGSQNNYHVSRHGPDSSGGPNKASHGLFGAEQLGIKLGGAADFVRERAQAIREGDVILLGSKSDKNTGIEIHKCTPNLLDIVRTSQASSAPHPTNEQNNNVSSANRGPDKMLDSLGRNTGAESGVGAASQDAQGISEIGGGAPRGNVAPE
ncbi:hypothetical protein K437DRAFT_266356 [Tilletiaria anomala UBC 951]|uniref:Uncharacterized protein n=1 Tax=Tilletiaria anomala (strain ATCC 24038 / CBS 436.72 / UBC 951) TaxID=1037660 RepID=A0A066WFD1_TILAU|nr:uncharacterized protein K437DRAFT_266356 [Tilletiaria anomala UBC 951]KDN52687.1 hypothetical protein K437DRAFT_266356 [Tilletiaria anomala UBC 951]